MLKKLLCIFLCFCLLLNPVFSAEQKKSSSYFTVSKFLSGVERRLNSYFPLLRVYDAELSNGQLFLVIRKNKNLSLFVFQHQTNTENFYFGQMLRNASLFTSDQGKMQAVVRMAAQEFLPQDWTLHSVYNTEDQTLIVQQDGDRYLLQDRYSADFGMRSLFEDFKNSFLSAAQFADRLKKQGYQIRIVNGKAYIFRGLLGGGDKEDKEKIEKLIDHNEHEKIVPILQTISPALSSHLWKSLFIKNAKPEMLEVILRHFLIKTQEDQKELPHLLKLINTSAHGLTINQIVTSMLYEARRHGWNSVPVVLRRNLLTFVDYERKFIYYTQRHFEEYIAQEETKQNTYFGVDLTDDSDSGDETALNALDIRERKKILDSAKSRALAAGQSSFKKVKTKIDKRAKDESSGVRVNKKSTKPGKIKTLDSLTVSDIVTSAANRERAEIKKSLEKQVVEDLKILNEGYAEAVQQKKLRELLAKLKTQFVVMQVRGLSYSTSFWSARQRRAHRRRQEQGQALYSSAVHALANVPLQEDLPQDTSLLEQRAQNLKQDLVNLRESQSLKVNKKTYLSAADYLQEIYTTNYDGFVSVAKQLLSVGNNPFISTSDRPYHSLRYAFGIKYYQGHQDERLRPRWQKSGRAERAKSGKVYLSIHPISDYDSDGASSVPQLVWEGRIFVDNQIVAERESSFQAFMPSDRVIEHFVAKYPSFRGYKSIYLQKYGLDEELYNLFSQLLLQNAPHTPKHKVAKLMLGEWLCMYHEVRLIEAAQEYCKKKNKVLVYRQYDGTFGFDLAPDTPNRPGVKKDVRDSVKKVRISRESSPATFDSVESFSKRLAKLDLNADSKPKKSLIQQFDAVADSSESEQNSSTPSEIEEEGQPQAGVAHQTKGGGDCAFHACFGTFYQGQYQISDERVADMRQEMVNFLSQWESLEDVPETLLHENADLTLRDLIRLNMQDEFKNSDEIMKNENDYDGYLTSITDKGRYLWLNEIYLLAILSNTTIVYWGDNAQPRDTFRPNPALLEGYESDFNWQAPASEVNIYAQNPGHYERFVLYEEPLMLKSLKFARWVQELRETLDFSAWLTFVFSIGSFLEISAFYFFAPDYAWLGTIILFSVQLVIGTILILYSAQKFADDHRQVFYHLKDVAHVPNILEQKQIKRFAVQSGILFLFLYSVSTFLFYEFLFAFLSDSSVYFFAVLTAYLAGTVLLVWSALFMFHHLKNKHTLKKNKLPQDDLKMIQAELKKEDDLPLPELQSVELNLRALQTSRQSQ